MISAAHLRNHVIVPVLEHLDMDSLAAQNLLLGTAAVESEMGTYLVQIRGPAMGIYQMEGPTHDDLWDGYIKQRPLLRAKLADLMISRTPAHLQLAGNLYYATAMARLLYRRSPVPLPKPDDIEGLGRMWKAVWNTNLGKGRVDTFVDAY